MPPSKFHRSIAAMMLVGLVATTEGCSSWRRRASVSQLAESREHVFDGQRHAARGDWIRAEALYREAVESCPQDERAYGHLAEALAMQGRTTDAIETQRRAVELSAGEARHRIRLGEMLLQAGQVSEALSEAEIALETDRTSTEAWNLKAQALLAAGRDREALSCLHRSLAIDESQSWVLMTTATIHERENKPQRALATWQAAADLYPRDEVPAELLYRQAEALRRLDRRPEAIERLLEARRRDPDSMTVLVALADLQWEIGDHANAQLTLSHLQRRWPEDPTVRTLQQNWQFASQPTPLYR